MVCLRYILEWIILMTILGFARRKLGQGARHRNTCTNNIEHAALICRQVSSSETIWMKRGLQYVCFSQFLHNFSIVFRAWYYSTCRLKLFFSVTNGQIPKLQVTMVIQYIHAHSLAQALQLPSKVNKYRFVAYMFSHSRVLLIFF